MRLSLLVAGGYFLIVGLAAWFVLDVFVAEVKPGVRKTMEDTLVDNAHLIAELARPALTGSARERRAAGRQIEAALRRYRERFVDARIWDHRKQTLDLSFYITDAAGRVIHATDPSLIGADYSRWNDVRLTLDGGYGVRSTRADPADEDSSVMHVAAPIRDDGHIIGVVSLAKPTRSVGPIVAASKDKIRARGLLLLLLAALIGVAFSWMLGHSIDRLGRYARAVTAGARVQPQRSRVRELADLTDALTAMREQLEGKQYVERYLHSLTHELKSPLAAIRGAAELLGEQDMPTADRARFLTNIRDQAERLSHIAERLLELARLEQQQALTRCEPVELAALLTETVAVLAPIAARRRLALALEAPRPIWTQGDPFLLAQALRNLLDNAIDFSPAGARVEIRLQRVEDRVAIGILDQGPGIPDYAEEKVFERFFSLPRPGAAHKSTGLGLSFVREVALLHGGAIRLENRQPRGLHARLTLDASDFTETSPNFTAT